MQPSFEYAIDAMVRALSDTVRPAVNPDDKAAAEQLAIVIGSLGMLRSQIDYAHWFEVTEAQDMAGLAQSLADLADLPAAVEARDAAARTLALAARHDITLSTLREANRELREWISALIEQGAARDPDSLGKKIDRIVLDHSKRQVTRERAYVAGAGFDVFPDNLVSIEAALTAG